MFDQLSNSSFRALKASGMIKMNIYSQKKLNFLGKIFMVLITKNGF